MIDTRATVYPLLTALVLGCADETAPAPAPLPPGLSQGQPPSQAPPPHVVGSFTVDLPPTTLDPGSDWTRCWLLPLDAPEASLIVGGGKMTTSVGLHHVFVIGRPKTGEGVRPCPSDGTAMPGGEAYDFANAGAFLFAGSTGTEGEEWQSFPEGMGFPISEAFELVVVAHFSNPTADELPITTSFEWFTIDPTKVTHELGPFAWALTGWEIPPGSTHTAETSCEPPDEMHIVSVIPHMHALGTSFFGELVGGPRDGERWLDSGGFDPENGVITQYDPAIDLSMADGVKFGCTWENGSNATVYEGTSGAQEMCLLLGYAYPYEHAFSALSNSAGCAMIAPTPPE